MANNPIHAWQAEDGYPNSHDPKGSSTITFELSFGLLALCMGMLFYMDGKPASLFLGTGLVLFGLFLVVRALYWRILVSTCKKYAGLLNASSGTSVADFAAALGISTIEAIENVEILINKGMLEGVMLDKQTREFIPVDDISKQTSKSNVQTDHMSRELVEAECNGCGARKAIAPGTSTTCDHCGSEIHA